MIVVEINAETFGTITINGESSIFYPNVKKIIKPRDGDVVKIQISESDIFRDERTAYMSRNNQTLFSDDNKTGNTGTN